MRTAGFIGALLLIGLVACRNESTGPVAASLSVNADPIVLPQGASYQLVVVVLDAQGKTISGVTVDYVARSPTIATVSASGLVTATGPAGTGELEVRAAGLVRVVGLRVDPVAIRLALAPSPIAVPQNGSAQLEARVLDRRDTPIPEARFIYHSSNAAVVTVDSTGRLTSVGPAGQVTIRVTSASLSASTIAVVVQTPTAIAIEPSPIRLGKGRSIALRTTVMDALGAPIPSLRVALESDNPSLVTVSSDTLLTSVAGAGATTITARIGELSRVVTVTVTNTTSPSGLDTSSVPASRFGYGVAVSSTGRAVIAHVNGDLTLLSLTDSTAPVIIPFPGASQTLSATFNASGTTAYVARGDNGNTIDVLNVALRQVTDRIPLPTRPLDLAITRAGTQLFIGTFDTVLRLDLSSREVTRGVSVGTYPYGGALHLTLNRAETYLYATFGSYGVKEIDAARMEVRRELPVPPGAALCQGTALSSDDRWLYAVCETGHLVEWDLSTGLWTRSIRLQPDCLLAVDVVLTPDDRLFAVSCYSSGGIQLYDRSSGNHLVTHRSVYEPRRLAVSSDGTTIVATSSEARAFIIR